MSEQVEMAEEPVFQFDFTGLPDGYIARVLMDADNKCFWAVYGKANSGSRILEGEPYSLMQDPEDLYDDLEYDLRVLIEKTTNYAENRRRLGW